MKCDVCGHKINKIFLDKVVGTCVKDSKGKKRWVCPDCQKTLKTKDNILKRLE